MSDARALTERERALIAAVREKAYILYEGKQVPHRSCGIALAETFGSAMTWYQAQVPAPAAGSPVSGRRGAP
jgi:hypothetical protein